MNEKDIKKLINKFFFKKSNKNYYIDELNIVQNKSRIDLAYFFENYNIGLEIKSDKDNFNRLSRQTKFYDQIFKYNYLVIGQTKLKKIDTINNILPEHWGIIGISKNKIEILKKGKINPNRIKDSCCRLIEPSLIKKILFDYKKINKPVGSYNISRIASENLDWQEIDKLIFVSNQKKSSI